MNNPRLNAFTVNEIHRLLELIASYADNIREQDVLFSQKIKHSRIIYIDVDLQCMLQQVLKEYLAKSQQLSELQ